MNLLRSFLSSLLFAAFLGSPIAAIAAPVPETMSPNREVAAYGKRRGNEEAGNQRTARTEIPQQARPDSYARGGRNGGKEIINAQAKGVQEASEQYQKTMFHYNERTPAKWGWNTSEQQAEGVDPRRLGIQEGEEKGWITDKLASSAGTLYPGMLWAAQTGGGAVGAKGKWAGMKATNGPIAAAMLRAGNMARSFAQSPEIGRMKEMANNMAAQGSRASSAGEDAKLNQEAVFDTYMDYLINVANEEAGAPCSSRAVSKTYANVVWMVQQMYRQCYIPMAILFLLPGAIITQTKAFVKTGFLNDGRMPDPDTLSPFVGIARSVVAVFLIPATQLAVSYCIDVGNALEDSCHPYVNLPLIYMWCEEQIQILSPDQQSNLIKDMPQMPQAPYRGKFAGMPVAGAQLGQMSGLDLALMELVNESYHMLTIGLDVISAFQLVLMCYLFLLGPIAAAFFAWPQLGRSLFRQCFSVWLDAVVVLALWKFWWNIVLVCMTVRLESGGIDPFNPFEVYYLIAFFCILLVMPFNPFDFHASGLVSMIESKAAGVVAKVAQGGKSAGGGKGGAKGDAGHAKFAGR